LSKKDDTGRREAEKLLKDDTSRGEKAVAKLHDSKETNDDTGRLVEHRKCGSRAPR